LYFFHNRLSLLPFSKLLALHKKLDMYKLFVIVFSVVALTSCGVKVPFTPQIKDEFGLDENEKMRKVQFFTSHTIILDEDTKKDSQNSTQNGALVSSSNSKKESIIIPAGTRCVFEDFGPKGEIQVRFELGDQKIISFATKAEGSSNAKRYYFEADWQAQGGAKVKYGGGTYRVDLLRGSPRTAHLLVVKKRLEKSRRKERVVKGMKV
jgi:hypothetical protein